MITDTALTILPETGPECCSHLAVDHEPVWYLVRAHANRGGGVTVMAFSTHLPASLSAPTLCEAILAASVNAPWIRLRLNPATTYYLARARCWSQAESCYWLAYDHSGSLRNLIVA